MGKRGAIRPIERRAHEFFRSFSVAQSKYWSKIAEINPQRRITAVTTGRFDLNQSINQSIISLLTYDKTHMLTLDTELQYKKSQYESLYSMRIKNLESAGVRPSRFQSFGIGYTSRSQ